MKIYHLFLILSVAACVTVSAYGIPKPAPVNEYLIHEDGGLIYDLLRREAEKTDQLAAYKNTDCETLNIEINGFKLTARVPKSASAYDVIPIPYMLTAKSDTDLFPVAVEATAFEDASRRKNRDLFDLALPGKLNLDVQYLGSITAHIDRSKRHIMKPDLSDTPGEYPPFTRKPFVRSGTVEAGDVIWFKFRVKNTGNTILDPEGVGGILFNPQIFLMDSAGEYKYYGKPENIYIRDTNYLYPGEYHDIWVHFRVEGKELTPQNFGLAPGKYLIKFNTVYRSEKEFNWLLNMWEGTLMHTFEQPIVVESSARKTPVPQGKVTFTDGGTNDKITRWIHTFQEFMTAYDCWQKLPDGRNSVSGTLYLQVAPWTKNVVVKLISAKDRSISTVSVPIRVDTESLSVKFNPSTKKNIIKNGMREPVIFSQLMVDMRSMVHHGPYPEKHIISRMKEMMDCGVNVLCTTSMPWLYDLYQFKDWNYHGESWKYALDVARKLGMQIEGWGAYSYDRGTIEGIANWVTGKNIKLKQFLNGHYYGVENADPLLPWANGIAWLYQFHRWGDLFYQSEDGVVPFSSEDTRGWMRQDFNVRYKLGESTKEAFREWVKKKYGDIATVNTAWNTSFQSFNEIDPEANQNKGPFGHEFEYTNPDHAFHDWNAAVMDLDIFRTELRVKNYRETLAMVRREVPGASIAIRTEGANVMVTGIDPETDNPHFRHIFYSQYRCGLVADIIQKSKLVKSHSDYTTIPYTPSEIRQLTRMSVDQGITPMYLAQYNNMRDIAINSKYGTEYQMHYNLPEPRKGAMMHTLTALYPWFKAVYEEGGVPSALWEDYCCDGFVTETQKREMKFFMGKLNRVLETPEAIEKRNVNPEDLPSQEWRNKSKAKKSFNVNIGVKIDQ